MSDSKPREFGSLEEIWDEIRDWGRNELLDMTYEIQVDGLRYGHLLPSLDVIRRELRQGVVTSSDTVPAGLIKTQIDEEVLRYLGSVDEAVNDPENDRAESQTEFQVRHFLNGWVEEARKTSVSVDIIVSYSELGSQDALEFYIQVWSPEFVSSREDFVRGYQSGLEFAKRIAAISPDAEVCAVVDDQIILNVS